MAKRERLSLHSTKKELVSCQMCSSLQNSSPSEPALISLLFPFSRLSYPIQRSKNLWVSFIHRSSSFRLNPVIENFIFKGFHLVLLINHPLLRKIITFSHIFFPFLSLDLKDPFFFIFNFLKQVICMLAWTQEKSARNKTKSFFHEVEQLLIIPP